ncbi:MAG: glycosyltransferase [Humidesulfovibrio sp.]|uniref:glycosyltransferase family 2 protein n=1 Tax=Humidesulfovibrio sp. TaxID=2910988 RepID=UPI0027F94B5F|nr:glycosyltransferase [Humidesulfovibrio sp.]MDQ7834348.1 glycosyltransferase [Humidesulfovibrio sp.]
MPEISVIIPTYKRPQSLVETLESLRQQTFGDFEVLVVDNAADPETQVAAESFAKRSPFSVRCLSHPYGGSSGARNHGVLNARAELLVFTDDDVSPAPGWLAEYRRRFQENPDMLVSGGRVVPLWEAPPEPWLLDYISGTWYFGPYALMDQGPEFFTGPDVWFFSCNMAIRSKVFSWTGFHPEMYGGKTVGDGESGLFADIATAGGCIGYSPEAEVNHRIHKGRMTPAYLRKWAWHLGGCLMFQKWRGRRRTLGALCAEALGIVRDFGGSWLRAALTPEGVDRERIDLGCRAEEGRCRVAYVYWMLRRDPQVIEALDMDHFAVLSKE